MPANGTWYSTLSPRLIGSEYCSRIIEILCRTQSKGRSRKCELHSTVDEDPNHIALDKTVIQLGEHRFGCTLLLIQKRSRFCIPGCTRDYDLIDRTIPVELIEKHDFDDAVFLIDGKTSSNCTPSIRAPISIRKT